MENINLRSIRWESIKSVFLSIAQTEKISRADISAETDLSLMTVGKVVDALMDIQVIEQTKENKNSAGRRAGLLSVTLDKYSVILDLTSKDFCCCIMDLRLNPVEKLCYRYVDSMPFSDNLEQFLKNVSDFLSQTMSDGVRIGVGVSVPGTYFPDTNRTRSQFLPELDTIDLPQIIGKYIPTDSLLIDSGYNAAAMSNIAQIKGVKNNAIYYWHISANGLHGAIFHSGKVLHGAHYLAGNFGQMVVQTGVTLNSLLKLTNSPEENALSLARALHNTIRFSDPDVVILECTLYENGADFCDLIRQMLVEKFDLTPETMPQILVTSGSVPHAFRGLTMKLRETWLHDRIFPKD